MNRPRVLLIAADSDPRGATGPLHAWNLAHRLAEHCEIELVTHGRCREAIHDLGAFAPGNVRFVDGARGWWFGPTALGIARERSNRGLVDVVHLLDPLGPRTIRGLARLDAALVVGPTTAPLHSATRLADLALVAAQTALGELSAGGKGRAVAIDPCAVDTDLLEPTGSRRGDALRVVMPCTAASHEALEAALHSLPQLDGIGFDLLGDDPALQALARTLGVADRTRFLGNLPAANLRRTLQAADLLLDPSPAGARVDLALAAMALGVPVVAVRGSATAAYTTSLTGLHLESNDGPEFRWALCEALRHFRDDEAMRRQAGRAARCHVERCHSWNRRVADVLAHYRTALAARTAPRRPILLAAPAGLYGSA